MARNIEIKARLRSFDSMMSIVSEIAREAAAREPELIEQDDTFFTCATGRLKLRVFADGHGELIAYERPDSTGPKTSDYSITQIAEPNDLRETLTRALGRAGRVIKRRTLFILGRTRVHLDRVEGLGDFLELEVVLSEGESTEIGVAEAHALLEQMQVDSSQLVSGAYVDLLRA